MNSVLKKSALVLVLAFVMEACSGPTLRPDPVLPSNYPTAEFSACGEHWHGLGTCVLTRGQDINSINLSLRGYVQGTIRVVSEKCEVDDIFRYSGSKDLPYTLQGKASESCLLSFVVLPELPGEDSSGVPIRSFKGALWLRVIDSGDQLQNFRSKVSESADAALVAQIDAPDGMVHAIFRGCGTQFESDVPVSKGQVSVKLSQLFADLTQIKRCVIAGRLDYQRSGFVTTEHRAPPQSMYLSWMVWVYGAAYVPLPTPDVSLADGKLTVVADAAASLISLDDTLKYDTKAKFKFDASKPHVLRVLTTGGRSVIGEWDGKEWSWKK